MSELQQRRDAAIARLDAAIAGLEEGAIRRLLDALLASYEAVEGRIQRIYNRESSQGAEFLLKRQLLIQDDLRVMLEALDVPPEVRAELRGPIRDAMATADDYTRELILQSAAAQKIENYRLEARSVSSVPAAAIADQVSRGWDRLKNYNTQAKERIIQVVSMGLAQGLSWRKTASALRQQIGQFASDAETVARTEILSANNAQIKRTLAANGFGYGQWIATRDDRSCPVCMARHMHVYRLENIVIPAHPRCLVGETVVSAGTVHAGTFREYRGEIVTLETSSGKKLTCTPNHPILTDQGWVSAGMLDEGDSVFCRRNGEGSQIADPNNQQAPARISEIVASFRKSSGVMPISMKVSAEDFHGDGIGSKVCVVSPNGLLWDAFNASGGHPFMHQNFAGGSVGQTALLADRLSTLLVPGQGNSPGCSVCGSDLVGSLLWGHSLPLEGFGLGLPSRLYASAHQDISYSTPGDPKPLGDGVLRSSIHVLMNHFSPECIIRKESSLHVGPVYNLETKDGWYIANDIVTHNCRCFLAPWDPSFERAGAWDAERDRAAFRDGLKILQDAGRSPAYGKVSGFEKAAGMTEPPKAYWSPRDDG